MRFPEDRYSRERLRVDTALRFIRLEARTRTIRQWTGLTDDRIRRLYKGYMVDEGLDTITRHRGKSPHQAGWFVRTARLRHESALFASVCYLFGMLPQRAGESAAVARGDLQRGVQLCQAYEVYRGMCPAPLISFEYAVLLFKTLCRNFEITLSLCQSCGALLIAERLSLQVTRCTSCSNC